MIKRIQNTVIQMLTDAINLILIDTGNESYINKFVLRMQTPTTQEEVDRRENLNNKVEFVRNVMDTLSDVENVPTKLKILKSLLSNTIHDSEVIQLLQNEIDDIEAKLSSDEVEDESEISDPTEEAYPDSEPLDFSTDNNISSADAVTNDNSEELSTDEKLPTPDDLDIGDVSDATNPNLE